LMFLLLSSVFLRVIASLMSSGESGSPLFLNFI
jgi:hypothetical protein